MPHSHTNDKDLAHVTSDFIFGTLATAALRLEAMRAAAWRSWKAWSACRR